MNAGQLRKLLATDIPDNTPLLAEGSDHSLYEVDAEHCIAAKMGRGEYYEYFGDEHMTEGEVKVQALIVR